MYLFCLLSLLTQSEVSARSYSPTSYFTYTFKTMLLCYFKLMEMLWLFGFEAVQDKLDQMVFLWSDIQALLEEREGKLLDVMDLAEKFWCDHCALIVTIKDTHDLLKELEEPGVDPSVVKQQQESVEVWSLSESTCTVVFI